MTTVHIIADALWTGLLGVLLGSLGRFVWLNRARIVEALRGR